MPIDLFQPPYYDDYLDSKDSTGAQFHSRGFNQILFKPGYAVQARELTQMQSILKDQIGKFGSNVFKHGSMVVPGNSFSQLNLCRIRATTASYDIMNLEGSEIYYQSTGLRAFVKKVTSNNGKASIYLQYMNSGIDDSKIFVAGQTILIQGGSSFIIDSGDSVSAASMAFINPGVFFINGSFVYVGAQSTVIDDSSTPTKSVRLKIVESIIDSDADSTLLDPAQGTNNYAAPGADRLVMKLELYSANPTDPITDDIIELMRYNAGALEEHANAPKYNEIEKFMARRTYEESGNYVVNGLAVTVREHLKSTTNGGVYPAPPVDLSYQFGGINYDPKRYGYSNLLAVAVSAGKAYVSGFGVNKLAQTIIPIDKSREYVTEAVTTSLSYGQYFYVTNFSVSQGLPNVTAKDTVDICSYYNATTVIGSAKILALDLHESASTISDSIYKLVVTDLVLNAGSSLTDIGKIRKSTGNTFTCKVLHKYVMLPSVTGIDYTSKAGATEYSVKTASATATQAVIHRSIAERNELYVYRDTVEPIPTSSDVISEYAYAAHVVGSLVPNVSGKIVSVTSLVTNLSNSMLVPFDIDAIKSVKNEANNVDIAYKVYYHATATVSGTTATFTAPGTMVFDTIEQGNLIIFNYTTGVIVSTSVASTPTTTSLVVSAQTNGHVIYIIASGIKSGTTAAAKVKTETIISSEAIVLTVSNQNSELPLANFDVFSITSIVDGSNVDYTSSYVLNNGQRDYYYDLASIKYTPGYPKPAVGSTLYVTYKYFAHSTGADYFTVDSYPDAQKYKATTMLYTSNDSGTVYDLSRCIDFRPKKTDTTAFSINLDSRITTSVQKYIPRIDAVVCGSDSTLSVIRGMPSVNPVPPFVDESYIHLANLNIPAYTVNSNFVKIDKKNNRGYTMHDVAKLDDRIANIENYVTLTNLENTSVNYDIVDVKTGLSRFKSGYLIDSFTDMDTISDIYNEGFKVSYVSEMIVPLFDTCTVDFMPTSSGLSEVTLVGGENGVLMLPYTESVLAQQPLSSNVTNINPYALSAWEGKLVVSPSTDYWTETTFLPNQILNFTRNTTTMLTGTLQDNSMHNAGPTTVTVGPITPVTSAPGVTALETALTWGVSPAVITANYKTPTLIPQANPITLEQARLLITYS